jgi:NAD(P)H-hydrate epimerase
VVSAEAVSIIRENLAGCDALLLGCGIGQATTTRDMVRALLCSGAELPPTVVDADGLNILSASEGRNWWEEFSPIAVVTPHPGEMARLTGVPSDQVQQDRIGIAVESAVKWNKVTVLKGAHTVVAGPDGTAKVSPFTNPGLASGGTGDVLAGAIVGLLSQGATLEDAAALGVYLHGAAGERVREDLGDTGMIASDLLVELPRAIKDISEGV